MNKDNPAYTYAALISVAGLWGTSFAAAKIGMYELAPLNLVVLRFIIAAVVFGAILLIKRQDNTIERRDIPRFLLLGFLMMTSYFYIQYTGLVYTTTINAALIVATSPIWTVVIGAASGWERVGAARAGGIMVAFAGVVLIITKGAFAALLQSATLRGDLLLLLNAVVWAGLTVYGKTILRKYRPFVAMAYITIFGTLLLLPFGFIATPFAPEPLVWQLAGISWPTMAAATYLALLCSVYAYYVWYIGVERLGAVRTAAFNYFNPLFAVMTGVLFLHEAVTVYIAAGGTMVIAGVYLTNKAAAGRRETDQQRGESR
jgi:drug/metabolite transporter (DMT)-like permease